MATGVNLGPRSRVDPGGRANRRPHRGTNMQPRSEVPVPRFAATYTRSCSPHGPGGYYRKGRRGRGRGRRY